MRLDGDHQNLLDVTYGVLLLHMRNLQSFSVFIKR